MRKTLLLAIGISLAFLTVGYCATQYNSIGNVQMGTSTVNGSFGLTIFNKAQLVALTPATSGYLTFCNDCTYGTLCVSTGASVGAWVNVSSGTITSGFPCK